jgi:hypothetical protein
LNAEREQGFFAVPLGNAAWIGKQIVKRECAAIIALVD